MMRMIGFEAEYLFSYLTTIEPLLKWSYQINLINLLVIIFIKVNLYEIILTLMILAPTTIICKRKR